MKSKKQKGGGRTKGATSTVLVSLEDLNKVLRPNAMVPIARQFAAQLSLQNISVLSTYGNVIATVANAEKKETTAFEVKRFK